MRCIGHLSQNGMPRLLYCAIGTSVNNRHRLVGARVAFYSGQLEEQNGMAHLIHVGFTLDDNATTSRDRLRGKRGAQLQMVSLQWAVIAPKTRRLSADTGPGPVCDSILRASNLQASELTTRPLPQPFPFQRKGTLYSSKLEDASMTIRR